MRLHKAAKKNRFVLQLIGMKKLLAGLLLLMILMNAAVLLQNNKAKAGGEVAGTLKLSRIDLNDVKPGILPGLLRF